MWQSSLMNRFQRILCVVLSLLLMTPLNVSAAEVLQVQTSSMLQIGDHNRTYTVRLACLEVDSSNEVAAKIWLKSELPRRRRVNLRPEGANDGILLARVTPLGNEIDLSKGLSLEGLGRFTCDPEKN